MLHDERVLTYRRRAEALRICAETTTEIAAQDAMMRLAAEYEALARELELQTNQTSVVQLAS